VSAESRLRLSILLARDSFDIVEANLLMAVEATPGLDVRPYLDRVDALSEEADRRGGGVGGVVETLLLEGLRGAREDYDDPRNSLLNEVLDRGRGLPISLSALAVGVGERSGVPIAGIGMPGHFIVADLSGGKPRYVDPFNGWEEVTHEDCERLVRTSAGVALEPRHLLPVDSRAMLARMLANLRGAYLARRRLADALWCAELSLLIAPDEGPLVREHVVLLAGLGRYDDAEGEAQAYIRAYPDSPERESLERQVAAVQDMRRSMN
jgi:regulator of sirC expression with transglutaminase-like and TPR domain